MPVVQPVLRTNSPRLLVRYPELWGDDLMTMSGARRAIADANALAGEQRYRMRSVDRWLLYRCPFLFARTRLREVPPDEILRVAPVAGFGRYRVMESWRYRIEYKGNHDLEPLIHAFHQAVLKNRAKTVLDAKPFAAFNQAPGSAGPALGRHRAAGRGSR